MTPLLVSTGDGGGGAAIAAYRLLQGLREAGCDARMHVGFKHSHDPAVSGPTTLMDRGVMRLRSGLEHLISQHSCQSDSGLHSTALLPGSGFKVPPAREFDVLNLHWINRAYVRPKLLARVNRPVVWTMHDMWPFTGGCHYDSGCGRFVEKCGNCPMLTRRGNFDLSRRLWRRKEKAWRKVNLTVVSPSRWLAEKARRSSLFGQRRIEVIPNGLDLEQFSPRDTSMCRSVLKLPEDKKIILFGAVGATTDHRKGFDLLQSALELLAVEGRAQQYLAVVLGATAAAGASGSGMATRYLGYLHDEISLVLALSASDVVVLPSRQENLSNILAESLACGKPCVAFDIGGNSDLIHHGESGYLAKPFDINDLAAGIRWVLEDDHRLASLGQTARAVAEQTVCIKQSAARYLALFCELTENRRG